MKWVPLRANSISEGSGDVLVAMVATASLAGRRQMAGQTDGGAEQLGGAFPLERRLALHQHLQRSTQRILGK